jgi:hypothetical protein
MTDEEAEAQFQEMRNLAKEVATILAGASQSHIALASAEVAVASLLIGYAPDPLEAADFFHQRLREAITRTILTTH